MEKFTYFWTQNSPFSQWHTCLFNDGHRTYSCMEQYMMYQKAMLFKDDEIAKQILKTQNPKEIKALGRKVKNFNAKIWDKEKRKIVYSGNYLKYTQNPHLKAELLKTKGTTLVEASPYDKIWGIGLSKDDPKAKSRDTWCGQNLLGEILTKLRDSLLEGETI